MGGGRNLRANFKFVKALESSRVSRAVWSLDSCLGNDSSIYMQSCLGTLRTGVVHGESQASNNCWLATTPLLIPLKVLYLLFYLCFIPILFLTWVRLLGTPQKKVLPCINHCGEKK